MEEAVISKLDLYRKLTGYGVLSEHRRATQISGHPLSIDVTAEGEMERALQLVQAMQRGLDEVNGYQACISDIQAAYDKRDHEAFREGLQELVAIIRME